MHANENKRDRFSEKSRLLYSPSDEQECPRNVDFKDDEEAYSGIFKF